MKLSVFTLLSISAASVLAAPSSPAAVPSVIQPSGSTTLCLGAASNADGAAVVLQECSFSSPNGVPSSQTWTAVGSTLQIFGNKCLDDTDGDLTNGRKMQIWTCGAGNPNQQWFEAEGAITLSGGANKCLDNTDGKDVVGNPAQIWDCTGGPNQKWTFIPTTSTPPSTGQQIKPGKDASQCLTAASNSDNAAVSIQPCNGSASQGWTATGGTLQIFGNKCLDVPNGSTADGVKMQIFTCFSGNTNQKYTVTSSKQIQWTNKGECLDLTDGNTSPGTLAQMFTCFSGNTNQIWNFV